jgi:L-lactate dehydrogenase complex protein LldG
VVSTAAPIVIPAEFLAAAAAHRLTVHGPVAADHAAAAVVDVVARIAAGGTVARPLADATLEHFGILDALTGLPGPRADAPDWTTALPHAAVGVTGVDLAVAATGTLVIATHAGRPRGTHILPRAHVAVVSLATIVPTLADALASLAVDGLASNVSWVSGPSRTADLEMRPTIGVHGPVAVDLVVVG